MDKQMNLGEKEEFRKPVSVKNVVQKLKFDQLKNEWEKIKEEKKEKTKVDFFKK